MVWTKLDDGFVSHGKIMGLSDRAFRLHVTVLVECNRMGTDGIITVRMLKGLPGPIRWPAVKSHVAELVGCMAWEEVPWHGTRPPDAGPGPWMVHDFLDHNPSAESVKLKNLAAKERMARIRSREHIDGVLANEQRTGSDPFAKCSPTPTRPDPSRPDLILTDKGVQGEEPPLTLTPAEPKRRRSVEVPKPMHDTWSPPPALVDALATRYGVSRDRIMSCVPEWRLYWISDGKVTSERGWASTLSNWIGSQAKNGKLYAAAPEPKPMTRWVG